MAGLSLRVTADGTALQEVLGRIENKAERAKKVEATRHRLDRERESKLQEALARQQEEFKRVE